MTDSVISSMISFKKSVALTNLVGLILSNTPLFPNLPKSNHTCCMHEAQFIILSSIIKVIPKEKVTKRILVRNNQTRPEDLIAHP